MKYKANADYKKSKINYSNLGSPAKHGRLMDGESVEITEVPTKLKGLLVEVGKPKAKTKEK